MQVLELCPVGLWSRKEKMDMLKALMAFGVPETIPADGETTEESADHKSLQDEGKRPEDVAGDAGNVRILVVTRESVLRWMTPFNGCLDGGRTYIGFERR